MIFHFSSDLAGVQEHPWKVPALSNPPDLPGVLHSHLRPGQVTSLHCANWAPCGAI